MIDLFIRSQRDAIREGLAECRATRLHNAQRERDRLALWQARYDMAVARRR